jgi:hypothetical protein
LSGFKEKFLADIGILGLLIAFKGEQLKLGLEELLAIEFLFGVIELPA